MATTAVQPPSDYRVDLAVFQGPLDLLLYLIKKEEVDIYDIPIARITRQYLKYIDIMTVLDLEVAGEFILMAATLIRIKTRLLLPRDEEDSEEPDPREELIMALIEYRKYREAGEIFRERVLAEERKYVPLNPVEKIKGRLDLEPVTKLYDLLIAFRDVLSGGQVESVHEISSREVTIEDRIRYILLSLADSEAVTFRDLFADAPNKIVAVVTFIAVLELARTRRIAVCQSVPFSEVRVYRGEAFRDEVQNIDITNVTAVREQVET
jgi:segregation and condensation protein A